MREQKRAFINHYGWNPDCDSIGEIESIALRSAIIASTMRNRTYAAGVNNDQKSEFKAVWKEYIEKIGTKYITQQQSLETFFQDVMTMRRVLNERFGDVLYGGGVRIGHCQKALAIYLKWRWCYSDSMPVPPMCAIDSKILNHCGIFGRYTKLDDEKEYRKWVGRVVETADNECLNPIFGVECHNVAEWELVTFNHLVAN